jgi:hypothetical protein
MSSRFFSFSLARSRAAFAALTAARSTTLPSPRAFVRGAARSRRRLLDRLRLILNAAHGVVLGDLDLGAALLGRPYA